MMPHEPGPIVILTGPPGAGKTTVAGHLVRSWERAVHLVRTRVDRGDARLDLPSLPTR